MLVTLLMKFFAESIQSVGRPKGSVKGLDTFLKNDNGKTDINSQELSSFLILIELFHFHERFQPPNPVKIFDKVR
jgi:hypothetical protein